MTRHKRLVGAAAALLLWATVLTGGADGVNTANSSGVFVSPSNIDSARGSIRLYEAQTGALLRTVLESGGPGQIQGLTLGKHGDVYGSFFDSHLNSGGQVLRISKPG